MTGSFSSFCTTVEIVCWKYRHGTSVRPTSKGIRLAQWHPQHIKMRPCALTYLTSAAKQEIERRNVWCCTNEHPHQLQKPKPDTVEFGSCHILQSSCPAACGQHKRSAQTETRHIQKNQKVSKSIKIRCLVQMCANNGATVPFPWSVVYTVPVPPGHVSPPSGAGSANGEFVRKIS